MDLELDPARSRAAGQGPRLHPAGPVPARGRVRGARRPHAGERRQREAGRPRLGLRRDQPRARGRGPRPRSVPADAGRGAVGPRHRGALGHPVAPVRSRSRRARRSRRSGSCGPHAEASGATRTRSPRRRPAPTRHGATTARRDGDGLGDRRREVARDLRRRRGLLRAPRPRRRRPREGHGLPGGQGHAGRAAGAHARSTCTRSCSSIRSSRSRACGSARTGSSAGSAGATTSRRTGSSRSG